MSDIAEKFGDRGIDFLNALKRALEKFENAPEASNPNYLNCAVEQLIMLDEKRKAAQPRSGKRDLTIPELLERLESDNRDIRYQARKKLRQFKPQELKLYGISLERLDVKRHLGPNRAV